MESLCFPGIGWAKCAALLISIEVEVRGQANPAESVMVDVRPDNYWSFQLAGNSPERFVIQVPFGTYSGRGLLRVDRCNRTPKTITVMLRDWFNTIDGIELADPYDFEADQRGYYHAREKVLLNVNYVGPPWIQKSRREDSEQLSTQ